MTGEQVAAQAEMVANRVRKTARHRRKWAQRAGVSCYRLYDRDIPEVPLAIDWYEGRLHIAMYARDELDDAWLAQVAAAVAAALEVAPRDVFTKWRERQKGTEQYERIGSAGARIAVAEDGLSFWVNLADYLDTGLFLDHRQTRAIVRAESAGARVLNLFCYTGAFTVHAAAGGAAATTSVDLSNTYLTWAHDNLILNRLDAPAHQRVRADVMDFLEQPDGPYDIVVLDPPTFSNSKRMRGVLDLRRDHPAIMRKALAATRPGGTIYFATNARSFALDASGFDASAVDEITHLTVPPDFDRRRPHRCWRIRR